MDKSLKLIFLKKKMRSEPVLVEISNVLIVLKPKIVCPWIDKVEKGKQHQLKMDSLEKYENTKKLEMDPETPSTPGTDPNNPGFVAKLMEIIINNLQIHLTNVHIRYEDTQVSFLFFYFL
jgi:vacuolar protein sorting-associated protein 13A/C